MTLPCDTQLNFYRLIEIEWPKTSEKRSFGHECPAKIQISLRICAVWSESSLGAFWIARSAKHLHADNEDFDQIARMRTLIWVFDGP